MAARADFQRAVDQFSDWRWRLNNLYYITDKGGRRVKFEMNSAQAQLFDSMHYMNVILKARQRGFTTFIQLFMLDAGLFNSNIRAGTIAHTLSDAQTIFRDKVRYPYDNLPDALRAAVPVTKDSASELVLGNNSSIRVGVSLRSGTLQYLHISEYGKICAKFPDKAREVRTGALNTVQAGNIVFVESTAEGQEGHYFELCRDAREKQRNRSRLTPLDFKFHFHPWWADPDYELDPEGVTIPDGHARFFAKLRETAGIELSPRKQAWYVKKAETQLGDMKREYPSTPDEAFEASIEGAYYGEALAQADLQQRVGVFPAVKPYVDPVTKQTVITPVDTAWDIGIGDSTAIWFFQRLGSRVRLVGYLHNSGEGLPYYVKELRRLAAERGWTYGDHYWPHDGVVEEWGSAKSRIEQARELKITPRIVPRMAIDDGINAVRAILPHCEFDAGACADGLKALRSYRKEWDEERSCWRDKPRHDWASDGADAFRTMASRYRESPAVAPKPAPKTEPVYEALPDGRVVANMTIREIVDAKMKRKARDE